MAFKTLVGISVSSTGLLESKLLNSFFKLDKVALKNKN